MQNSTFHPTLLCDTHTLTKSQNENNEFFCLNEITRATRPHETVKGETHNNY